MPKRSSKTKRPTDVNQLAHFLGKRSTGELDENKPTASTDRINAAEISRVMSAMGRRGGRIGGKRRMETMTAEQRKQIALKAAHTRWAKNQAERKGLA